MQKAVCAAELERPAPLQTFRFIPYLSAGALSDYVVAEQRSTNRDRGEYSGSGAKVGEGNESH